MNHFVELNLAETQAVVGGAAKPKAEGCARREERIAVDAAAAAKARQPQTRGCGGRVIVAAAY
jgi:hypothetical protein